MLSIWQYIATDQDTGCLNSCIKQRHTEIQDPAPGAGGSPGRNSKGCRTETEDSVDSVIASEMGIRLAVQSVLLQAQSLEFLDLQVPL